jgi:hypothetical protein
MLLVIDNHAFSVDERSSAPRASDRREEDLGAAMFTLERLAKATVPQRFVETYGVGTWQEWLLFLLPHLATHFEVEPDQLLHAWCAHYGVSLYLEANQ